MQTIDEMPAMPQQQSEQQQPAQPSPFDSDFQSQDNSTLEIITDENMLTITKMSPVPAVILINNIENGNQIASTLSVALRNQADKYEQKMFHTFSQDAELLLSFLMNTAGRQFDEEGNKQECKWQCLSIDFKAEDLQTNHILSGLLHIARERKYCILLISKSTYEKSQVPHCDVVITMNDKKELVYN